MFSPPPPGKTSDLQNESAECALKRWVLFGGWREALYLNEPGRGVGLIEEYCDGLETIAKEDPDFALRFGTRFHRDIVHIQRNPMLDWKYRPEMNCQLSFSNPYLPDAYYGTLATATPEAEDHYMDEYAHYAPIQELSKSLAKSCPVTPVKAKCPRKSPSKSSPRKRKIKDSPLKGTVTRVNTRIAPKSLFRLSDNAERYLASVLAGGPIDSWNMLDQYHTIDETNLDDVA
ncbi:hypothetical protein VI817_007537 [Penicillium citrinum]|nr:hypothetical protein VI817_007537 [Penicillium citrinum]